jgi:hypothetical protein
MLDYLRDSRGVAPRESVHGTPSDPQRDNDGQMWKLAHEGKGHARHSLVTSITLSGIVTGTAPVVGAAGRRRRYHQLVFGLIGQTGVYMSDMVLLSVQGWGRWYALPHTLSTLTDYEADSEAETQERDRCSVNIGCRCRPTHLAS